MDARTRWLARGHCDTLAEAVAALAAPDGAAAAIDVGCGEGFFARRLFAGRPEAVCGVDLAVRAARAAARAWPEATWVVANADRFLPFPDGSVDLVLSLFGRRPEREIARVLRPGGRLLVAVPAGDDLVELREAAQGRGELRDRAPAVVREFAAAFRLRERRTWRERARLDRGAIEDVLAMTYRGARHSEKRRLAGTAELDATLSADLLHFLRVSG